MIKVDAAKVNMAVGLFISGPKDRWEELIVGWAKEVISKSLEEGLDLTSDDYHLAYFELPCGEGLMIKSVDDLPLSSVPCPCGDPGHWLVLFSEKELGVGGKT